MTNYDESEIPDSLYERALMLQNMLVAKVAGDHSTHDATYRELRRELMGDPKLKQLLPQFVRTCRDLDHLWGYAKQISSHWEPRRQHVRNEFAPLLNYLEGKHSAPVDQIAADTLVNFDPEGVHSVWEKALARRETDPDGAITSARTLLETVCKRILDEAGVGYSDADDLPKLYKLAAETLNIAPSQHAEIVFKRILGGCTSVVEGLGTLRNKIGDAHGKGAQGVRPAPRHAQLAVNLAGAMAIFLVETWIENQQRLPKAS